MTTKKVMSLPNFVNSCALKRNREDLLHCQKERRHFEKLYRLECQKNKKLTKDLTEATLTLQTLKEKLQKYMCPPCTQMKRKGEKFTRKRKSWQNIRNADTKCLRLDSYRHKLVTTLKEIPVCNRAEISIWLDSKRINFSIRENNFKERDNGTGVSADCKNLLHDHIYTCLDSTDRDEHEDIEDVDLGEIFDSQGRWQKLHVWRLIHVLDSFRISHKAYHELRMVCKGHLPPIWWLAKEKKKMSEEIPYIKHPKVSTCYKAATKYEAR